MHFLTEASYHEDFALLINSSFWIPIHVDFVRNKLDLQWKQQWLFTHYIRS